MKIAIIGGGIAGLTFAIAMKKSGHQIQIFEKKPEFNELGAAISVFPNALRVYRELGILDDVLAVCGEMKDVYIRTHKGKILSKSSPTYDLPNVCTRRSELIKVLLKHVDGELKANHEVTQIIRQENNRVYIQFNNGFTGTYDLVIGADGIHSKVRSHVIGDGRPVFQGYNIWRGVCASDYQLGYASETLGKGQRVGIVPIGKGYYGWWATCNEEFMQDDQPEGTKEKLKRLFGDWHDPIPELIEKSDEIIKNSLIDRPPTRRWFSGNCVLIGDAAHPTTPNLGQGGCTAIEGAYILARCIGMFGPNHKAYAKYENLHFDRVKAVNKTSLKMGAIGQTQNPLKIILRNLLIRLMPDPISLKMFDRFYAHDVTRLPYKSNMP